MGTPGYASASKPSQLWCLGLGCPFWIQHEVTKLSTFEQVLDAYFNGWRDGYKQALDDVDNVIDRTIGEDRTGE